MKARDIMTYPARTVREDCTLESAARTMLAHDISWFPVTDGAVKLVGILTESDFAGKEKGVPFSLFCLPQVFGDWLPEQGVEKMYAAARSRRVGEFMSRAVATVDIADDIAAVIVKMQKTGFHRLPVVVDGQPDGMIVRHDLLRLMQVRLAERRENMRRPWLALLALALAIPAGAQNRKTIYVDKMEGLEPFVEQALQAAELPFDFIEEQKQPELKAGLAKMHSAYGEIVYKHKLGRNETHRLELRDVARNKLIAFYDFPLRGDDESRRRAAQEFAAKVKKAWAKGSR